MSGKNKQFNDIKKGSNHDEVAAASGSSFVVFEELVAVGLLALRLLHLPELTNDPILASHLARVGLDLARQLLLPVLVGLLPVQPLFFVGQHLPVAKDLDVGQRLGLVRASAADVERG